MGAKLPDRAVARLAAQQEGVISTAQMRGLDLSYREINVRTRRANLHRVHRGVYVVGAPRLTPTGRLWAALLACGGPDAAAISHLTAAKVWHMRDRAPLRVDVATFGTSRSTETIRVHHTLVLDDLTHHDGLPITTPARTLIDSTPRLGDDELLRACNEARYRGLITDATIGPRRLRQALERLAATGPYRAKSELEELFLALIDRHALPRPLVNVALHGYTVDFLWPDRRLIVETDGRNHLRPHVYEADRERDAHLQELGHRVYRVTAKQLDERPGHVARRLARWLA